MHLNIKHEELTFVQLKGVLDPSKLNAPPAEAYQQVSHDDD